MDIAMDAMESGAKTDTWLGWQASRQASRLWKLVLSESAKQTLG